MNMPLALGLGAVSLGLLAGRRLRAPSGRAFGIPTLVEEVQRTIGVERATRRYLMYLVLPLWMSSGLVDWYHHRRTKIEETAGTRESAIHALMMLEAGTPVMLGLFLEVNPLILLLALGALAVHEATAFWDVSYAVGRREVTPSEQHTHSFLEVVPFMATAFLFALHWDEARTLVGMGRRSPRWRPRRKREPLPKGYVTGILAATVATVVVPYAEELWRCYRVDRTLAPHPVTRHVTYEAGESGAAPGAATAERTGARAD